jgi:hypothetical protein
MKEYTFTEDTAKKIIKSQTMSRIPIVVISVAAGIYVGNHQTGGEIFKNLTQLIILSFGLIGITTYGLIRGMKKGTKTLMLNKYILTETGIERHTPASKIIQIDFDKISSHHLLTKGLLLKSTNTKILIPSGLDNFEELSSNIIARLK